MGKYVLKEKDGYKQYTIYSKSGIKEVLALENVFPQYTFSFEEKVDTISTFYDNKSGDLATAGINISKNVENGRKGHIRIEREFMQQKGVIVDKNKEEKVYIHPIVVKDTIKDHMFFVIDGITNLFSTQFHIDLEHVVKNSIPKIIINSKAKRYKIYGGTGFKAEMFFEHVSYKNTETGRSDKNIMLTVRLLSSEQFLPSFNDFLAQLEKNVKQLIDSPESKYTIARRMTRPITKADLERAKEAKTKKKDSAF